MVVVSALSNLLLDSWKVGSYAERRLPIFPSARRGLPYWRTFVN